MREAPDLLIERKSRQPRLDRSTVGFTVVEVIAAMLMVTILAAIMAPGYLGWISRTRVNTARETVALAIREAQSKAKGNKTTWQVSFRENNGKLQWATHDAKITSPTWQNIDEPDVQIFKNTSYTTITGGTQGPWSIKFNAKGQVQDRATDEVNEYLGRITITSSKISAKRCVILSTLLGSIKTASDDDCKK